MNVSYLWRDNNKVSKVVWWLKLWTCWELQMMDDKHYKPTDTYHCLTTLKNLWIPVSVWLPGGAEQEAGLVGQVWLVLMPLCFRYTDKPVQPTQHLWLEEHRLFLAFFLPCCSWLNRQLLRSTPHVPSASWIFNAQWWKNTQYWKPRIRM